MIIDDHRGFCERLADFVGQQHGCTVVGVEGDAVAGLATIRATRPDVALVDVGLPAENGFWLAERIAELRAAVRVVMMSENGPEEYAAAAASAGAVAYLPKRAIALELPKLLRAVGEAATNVLGPARYRP